MKFMWLVGDKKNPRAKMTVSLLTTTTTKILVRTYINIYIV